MKQNVADAMLFVALAAIVAGVSLMSAPWAFIVAGVGIAAMAVWIGRNGGDA